ncbi:Alpha/Beta hydrolase protein [Mycena sanguinolenta]|nr:Alpha/Beta hydrolase protein [Mycena sanguinolenta]
MITLLFTSLYFLLGPAAVAQSSTVSLPYGTLQGFVSGNLTQFLGVPFAQAVRFEQPRDPATLQTIYNATSFGATTYPSVSEDCLSLNVFRPTVTDFSVGLPVFVWIYGGGFQSGNSRDYDLTPVVERSIERGAPIIAVTLNYRLTALGFLAGKEVAAAGISNLGLRDQIFGLQWVQKYISAFGGDPNQVVLQVVPYFPNEQSLTKFYWKGRSERRISFDRIPGAQQQSKLEHICAQQSGPAQHVPSLSDGQVDYNNLVTATNCSASPDTLNCLRHAPLDTFMAAVNATPNFFSYQSVNLVWGPRIDGDVIVRDAWVSISEGLYGKMPKMIGMCDDEGTLFSFSNLNITTHKEFLAYAHSNYLPKASSDQMEKLARLYPQDPTQGSPFGTDTANELTPEFKRMAAFQGDLLITSPRRFWLALASLTQNVWGWLNKGGKIANGPFGAAHTSDTPIWFTTTNGTDGMDPLLNFINTLDPNSAPSGSNNSILWPKWNTPSSSGPSSLLTFNDDGINITADTFRTEAIDFLNDLRLAELNNSS